MGYGHASLTLRISRGMKRRRLHARVKRAVLFVHVDGRGMRLGDRSSVGHQEFPKNTAMTALLVRAVAAHRE